MVAANSGVPMNTTRISAPAVRRMFRRGARRGARQLVLAQHPQARDGIAALEQGDALQMVQLVLQAAAQKPVALDLPLLAVQVEVAHARPRGALDGHGDAGARQAPLAFHDGIALRLHEHGVHEHDGVLLLRQVAVHHDEALGHAQLRRGDAAAVVFVHGLGHLLGKLSEAPIFRVARLAHRVQNRIGRLHDGDHAQRPSLFQWNVFPRRGCGLCRPLSVLAQELSSGLRKAP